MMDLVENFLDAAILTLFIYLLITVIWQWMEKKVTGERTYVLWHDVVAIVFSVVLAIALMFFQDVLIVLLVIALINITAQIVILIMLWNVVAELIGLRKINNLLKQQIESKDKQIKMLEELLINR
ncbi:hypothetical protein JTZ62_04795 [Mammaliicoccus sciuri]|uniref:hypothetical protein n=1 Tax=Mammaliicoccus sciuri TaxID=1296 RepID=UPI0019D368E8|nr:hypothetical protein [Mammaliicoccus sciuri]QSN68477.1 hypothetical protein JTZ62_04795 [Mammaliicoccus sciuri]UIU23218.1 hypothetical protein LLZ87_04805 [Mammaliicoccus sciuri]UIU26123.1 hypothetical protein LLZ92_04805 [Mammaliicoccus sciuri]